MELNFKGVEHAPEHESNILYFSSKGGEVSTIKHGFFELAYVEIDGYDIVPYSCGDPGDEYGLAALIDEEMLDDDIFWIYENEFFKAAKEVAFGL